MSTQESNPTKPATGKGPLDGLTQRLGALEESLTVVAGELGVSSMPKFKRLDPDSVYKEAIRRAQEAVEPLRLALRKLDARLEEMALSQTQMKRELAASREDSAKTESLAGIEAQVVALAARLDATVMPIDQNEGRIDAVNEAIGRLSLRLDTLWERLDTQANAARTPIDANDSATTQRLAALEQHLERVAKVVDNIQSTPQTRAEHDRQPGTIDGAATAQRLSTLEHRLERVANAVNANAQTTVAAAAAAAKGSVSEERFASWQNRIAADVERRLAQLPSMTAAAPQVDANFIADEVARQIQSLVREAAVSVDPVPLMAEMPADRAPDLNPLIVSATERAIVRLTHRLEKLEEWRRRKNGAASGKSGLMSRLFES